MGSRVGDIRKKFEGLSDVSKEATNSGRPLRYNQTGNHLKKETEIQHKNPCTTKGFIKRSHAFRSDKINRNPIVNNDNLQCSSKKSNSSNNKESHLENESRLFLDSMLTNDSSKKNSEPTSGKNAVRVSQNIKMAGFNILSGSNKSTKEQSKNIKNYLDIHKPDDDINNTNQLHSYEKPSSANQLPNLKTPMNNQDNNLCSTMNNSKKVNKSRNSPNTSGKSFESQINSPGCSDNKTRLADDSFSNTLKKVLSSPLPLGPPPKKPPRTFAHPADAISEDNLSQSRKNIRAEEDLVDTNHCSNSNKIPNNTTQILTLIRSKTESEIKLKKLEIALLNHRQNGNIIHPKTENIALGKEGKPTYRSYFKPTVENMESSNYNIAIRNRSLPDTPIEKNVNNSGCFNAGMLSCSNTIDLVNSSHIYDVPFQPKSKFYVKNLSPDETKPVIGVEENSFSKESPLFSNTNKSKTQEPVYAQIASRSPVKCSNKSGDLKGGSVLQVVNKMNLRFNDGSFNPLPLNKEKLKEKAKNNLHYMSSPILENVPLLQSPTPTKKTSGVHKKLGKGSPGRSSSVDFDKIVHSNTARSFSLDFSEDKDIQIDNEKIQKMVNEVYSKCLAMPQDSDSESTVSTPDDVAKPLPSSHHTSSADTQKERQQKTAERKTYLKRVCSRARSFHRPSLGFPHLFEYLLLIGLDLNPARCKVPYIKAKYPYDANVPEGIEQLCFPDATDWPPQACTEELGVGNCYCIVITHVSGTRKYGYCRRVQPEGAPICLPLAYCIVSPYKANNYFGQVLAELESRHGQPDQIMSSFIQQLYECPFPPPGKGLLITNPATGEKVEMLQRKLDPRQEDLDLARLLQLLRFSLFLQLFNTLLLERKVILLSYSISKLSTCVEGLCAALYPFHWQHTLVPIVPSTMPDLCQAPTPYLIGLLKTRDANMPPPLPFATMDQVLVVDVDDNKVLRSCGDESSVLPGRLARGLKEALQCAAPGRDDSLSPAHNLIASEALVALFVQLIGHYRDHIITSSNTGERHFQREGFVKKVQSNSVQNFLDWFTETTMFTAFIESRLDRSADPYGLFEQRCVEHLAQSQLAARGYRANINKTVKSFGLAYTVLGVRLSSGGPGSGR